MREEIVKLYEEKTRSSREMYDRARRIFPGGINHNARFFEPYPFFVQRAKEQYLWDVDGNRYVDYWCGHTALILGHSPAVVVRALAEQSPWGTMFGTANELSVRLGERVCEIVPCADMVRFCTTGAEATMYAIRLARAYTKKRTVLKAEGGWHGYSDSLFKGVTVPFGEPESAGIIEEEQKYVKTVPFNDPDAAAKAIRENQDDLACFAVEPFLGAGGCIPAQREYLQVLREETTRAGTLLLFDEIITGFRLALAGAQEHYRVEPDLCTLGKILGGGLPVGAVCGRSEIMELADPTKKRPKSQYCRIGGGTFSCNPLTMAAGLATLDFLAKKKDDVYGKLNQLGNEAMSQLSRVFTEAKIPAETTGLGSLFITHFPRPGQGAIRSSADAFAADRAKQSEYYFTLMTRFGIFVLAGHICAVSYAHTRQDIVDFVEATRALTETPILKHQP